MKVEKITEYPSIESIYECICSEKNIVFLDSSLKNNLGRYNIIGRNEYLKLEQGSIFEVNGVKTAGSLSEYLKKYLKHNKFENEYDLPLVAGGIGYFSYEYGMKNMDIDSKNKSAYTIPDARICFYDEFIIEDTKKNLLYLIGNGKLRDSNTSINELKKILNKAEMISLSSNGICENHKTDACSKMICKTDDDKQEYSKKINNMINYMYEGDIYVVNLTQQFDILSDMLPYQLFKVMRKKNPSPFGAYMNYEDFQVVSASMERFMKIKDSKIETRPIKGTRKRGQDKEQDELLKLELANSSKDKRELLMITDLERNDLNKICKPSTVKVTELFQVEEYATVFHLISNVTGEMENDADVVDMLEATFPGGSITGAPKYRAMELIEEQEKSKRNLYTGAIGYISLDGSCDFNVVIRTAVYQNGRYHIGVGGGLTCDSEEEFEYDELFVKAKSFLEILRRGVENEDQL